jgi:hypothetical protein
MMAGIGVMASRMGWLFMVVSMWVFVYRLIFREEDGLRQTQGVLSRVPESCSPVLARRASRRAEVNPDGHKPSPVK